MGLPFCAMGRVGRRQRQDICLHVRLFRAVYDEQRERKMQSILSLPIARSEEHTSAYRATNRFRKDWLDKTHLFVL